MILGKGIAHQRQKAEVIPQSLITKKFMATTQSPIEQLLQTIAAIPVDVINAVAQIVNSAESYLNTTFTNEQYLALLDDIHLVIKKKDDTKIFPHGFNCEMQLLYPQEYHAAQKTVNHLNDVLNQQLTTAETLFLSHHFVRAKSDSSYPGEITVLIKVLRAIIEGVNKAPLDTSTISVQRLFTHLRYLLVRQLRADMTDKKLIADALFEAVIRSQARAYATVEQIDIVLQERSGWTLSKNERFYLTLHLNSVMC